MPQSFADHQRLHAVIEGRVQGVSFRYYTSQTARRLGLTGWVANRWDGNVEIVAEGPQAALSELLAFLYQGPPSAVVTNVEHSWSEATGEFVEFGVRYL
jgi:acylphosphatase